MSPERAGARRATPGPEPRPAGPAATTAPGKLTLYYVAGLRYRKIAEVVELWITTVKGRIQEGRKRLRRILGTTYERRLTPRQPATAKRQSRAAVKEQVMAQLEELAIRYTSAGERAGIRAAQVAAERTVCRHQPQWRPGERHLAALAALRALAWVSKRTHRMYMCPIYARADDYRFFADLLASADVTVTSVDLDVAAGSREPQATVRLRRGTTRERGAGVGQSGVGARGRHGRTNPRPGSRPGMSAAWPPGDTLHRNRPRWCVRSRPPSPAIA